MKKETRYLYKYRSVSEHSLKMLKEGKYYFAPAYSFNDPLDCAVEAIYELPQIEKIIEHQAKVLQDNDGISFQEAVQKSQIIKTLPQKKLDEILQKLRDSIQKGRNGVKSTVDPCSKLIRVKSRLDPSEKGKSRLDPSDILVNESG